MNFNSCDFILSYIELSVSPPLLDPENRVIGQSVTLMSDANMDDTQIHVDFLSGDLKAGTTFTYNDFFFTLSEDQKAGDTVLNVYPLIDNFEQNMVFETIEIQRVWSINSLENTVDSNELTDRVFGKSIWATNKVTNRNYNIVVSGIKIKNDSGYQYLSNSVKLNKPLYFEIWVEENLILPINGLCFIKNIKEEILVDNNIEISFNLVIFKLGNIDKFLVYTIASEEFDVIISEEEGLEKYFFISQ